ncbi:hypothetical protein ACLOJK_041547 [Asimina triloba]
MDAYHVLLFLVAEIDGPPDQVGHGCSLLALSVVAAMAGGFQWKSRGQLLPVEGDGRWGSSVMIDCCWPSIADVALLDGTLVNGGDRLDCCLQLLLGYGLVRVRDHLGGIWMGSIRLAIEQLDSSNEMVGNLLCSGAMTTLPVSKDSSCRRCKEVDARRMEVVERRCRNCRLCSPGKTQVAARSELTIRACRSSSSNADRRRWRWMSVFTAIVWTV